MADTFKETAHLNIDQDKFNENFEAIFGRQCKKTGCLNKINDKSDKYCEEHKDEN